MSAPHQSCDQAQAVVAAPNAAAARPGWTLAASICASSLAFVDGSVVNVALSAIARDLHADAIGLQWTIDAYLLPLSALLLLGGAAGDHFGRRRLLIWGVALFAAASIACGFAPSLPVLLAARAVQGLGAAMLMPNSLALLGGAYEGEARGQAIGTWAAAGAIASAIGPPLGGWLVQVVGWRAIFYLNLPVAAAAMAIAWVYVAESEGSGRERLDWAGAALATGGLGALSWGLTLWSTRHGLHPGGAAALVAGVVLLGLFVLVEGRRGQAAMMPLGLFGSAPFVGLTLYTLLLYGALGGLLVLLPYVLIQAGGYSALRAGVALLPFPIVIGVGSRLAGRIAGGVGPRWPLTIGPTLAGLGFAVLTRADPGGGYWGHVFPGMALIALGMAGAVAPLTTAVLASVDAKHTGTASGFNSAVARTGGLITTAIAGAVIVRQGPALVDAFRAGAWVGAGLAWGAALSAFLTLAPLGHKQD